jgi:hypothetical protein
MQCGGAVRDGSASRVADEDGSFDVYRIKGRDQVGDVLLNALVLDALWAITFPVAAMIEQDLARTGEYVCVPRRLPHATVAAASRVKKAQSARGLTASNTDQRRLV